ncbi:unnamed protein product [Soboliphyme baturini]|uniref:Alkaline phosphatase n=1 Tax=Soboliphyme baturini TaxID=241478 RepID=A0A183IV67_9BILA|nr:unnamed protein product [Soboliphyme baturini]
MMGYAPCVKQALKGDSASQTEAADFMTQLPLKAIDAYTSINEDGTNTKLGVSGPNEMNVERCLPAVADKINAQKFFKDQGVQTDAFSGLALTVDGQLRRATSLVARRDIAIETEPQFSDVDPDRPPGMTQLRTEPDDHGKRSSPDFFYC